MAEVAERLRVYVLGWKAYFRLAQTPRLFKELEEWMRHRVRAIQLKHWKRGKTTTRPCLPRAPSPKWHGRSRSTAADGGATAACCSIRS
ncbi:group II intron maturase-specific domain-containing protein [Sinorhizobium meliloti]|uniref:group II intron maturase-specific domain-containing protein n=1 Tax=Rhizobium meliloti TaxID=382 RepID=UPI00399C2A0D